MNFDVETTGFDRAIRELEEIEDNLGQETPWMVGTRVNYAIYLEMGTRDIDPKPFFRPVLAEVRLQGIEGFIAHNTQTTVDEFDDIDTLVRVLALAMERRIKEIITQKGLIDTGTLRASVAAVPGMDASVLPTADDIDTSGDGLPSDVGPDIRADIEVDA